MKYSICSILYGNTNGFLVPTYTLEETMRRLAKIGCDGIEILCVAPHAWPYYMSEEKIRQVNEWREKYNIQVSSVMACPGSGQGGNVASPCKAEREWTIQYMKDVLDMAHKWECNKLCFVAGWYTFGERRIDAWNNTLDSLKQVAEYALPLGIDVCIEPTSEDSNVVDCPDDALLMAEQSGFSNVGIMFDTVHAFFRREDPADYVYTAGKQLRHIHFTDRDRMPPGHYDTDFYPVMQALKDIGYDGYVTMETGLPRPSGADSASRKSLDHLKAIEAMLI